MVEKLLETILQLLVGLLILLPQTQEIFNFLVERTYHFDFLEDVADKSVDRFTLVKSH